MRGVERRVLEQMLADGLSLEQIGRLVDRHPSTVGYWLEKYGLAAVNRDRHVSRGGLARDDLAAEVDRGKSISELAAHFAVSKTTVRHWLREYGLQTHRAERRQERIEAGKANGEIVMLRCEVNGVTEFRRRRPSGFRCLRCRADAVTRRRRQVKAVLIQDAGGRCSNCEYDQCVGALQFHHRVPAEKSFGLAQAGVARSLDRARAEAAKCVLLCANCHAEVEAGTLVLS
jgi:transposase